MICKVQRSLNAGGDRMLIYSRDRRTVFVEGPMAGDVEEILGGGLKCFVEVRIIGKGGYQIERRLDSSEWPTW